MRKLFFIAAAALLLAGCKANQAVYRKVYESAVATHDSNSVDPTIYDHYREMARQRVIKLGDDSLPLTVEFVSFTREPEADPSLMQRYNVVVASFKQIFNARRMRDRLSTIGYQTPFIVQTREPLYYVVASTANSAQAALDALRHVEADSNLRLKKPMPFVLMPAQAAR